MAKLCILEIQIENVVLFLGIFDNLHEFGIAVVFSALNNSDSQVSNDP